MLIGSAIVGPLAGIGVFTSWVSEHPLQAAALALFYELIHFFALLARGVWKRLENRYLDQTAQWLDFRLQCLFSGYRKKYLRHLSNECHDIDVNGLTTQGKYALALQRVFVELEVDPAPATSVPSEPAPKLPPALTEGRHHLWDYLQAGQNLAVIGGPGSGKTTLLRHICLIFATSHRARPRAARIHRLPVLLYLRGHAKQITENQDFSLVEAIEQSEIVKNQEEPPPAGWWKAQLHKDRCLILFDGLDEVADPDVRAKVAKWVNRMAKRHEGNLFLTTSRPGGYRENPLGSVTVLAVRPFSPHQIQSFVRNWYFANEMAARNAADPGAEELARHAARKGARDLLNRIRDSDTLTDLAVNPLLLTMIATVHKFRSELPGRRVELYREICDVFLGKRQQVRGVEDPVGLRPQQKQTVLEPLAFHMMLTGQREVGLHDALSVIKKPLSEVSPSLDGEAFLKLVEDTSGLLVQSETGVYRFAHKTFQEYLAAVHIRNQRLTSELTSRVEDEWWHETIRLYVAESDATPILQACLGRATSSVEVLVLALDCTDEANMVDPTERARVYSLLADGVEDPASRVVCSSALLSLRLRGSGTVERHSKLITHAEYQLFLDSDPGGAHRPHHWAEGQIVFSTGTGNDPVVGVDGTQARDFCEWLSSHPDATGSYRLPLPSDLTPTDISIGYWAFDGAGAELLGATGPPGLQDFVYSLAIDQTLPLADLDYKRLATDPDHSMNRAAALSKAHALRSRLDRSPDKILPQALDQIVVLCATLGQSATHSSVVDKQGSSHLFAQRLAAELKLPLGICAQCSLMLSDAMSRWTRSEISSIRRQLEAWYATRPRKRSGCARLAQVIRKRPPTEWGPWLLNGAKIAADAFVYFAIIQGRREGKLPVYGGIRIIREPVHSSTDPQS